MEFRKSVEDRFSPIVIVAASQDVEKTCKQLGVTFVQMLRPFRWLPKDAHVRTTKDTEIIMVRNFSVRFHTLSNVKGAEDDRFAKNVGAMLKECIDKPSGTQNDLEVAVAEALTQTDTVHPTSAIRVVSTTPWFDRFRQEYLANFRFNHVDTFDHPVGAMVAVSSASADPISEFKLLFPQRPPEFNACGVDSNWATYYVLVHDLSTTRDYERVLKNMGDTFGPGNCRVLLLNTKEPSDANAHVWQHAYSRLEDSPADAVHARLGRLDLTAVGALMEQYLTFALLPFLERRVRALVQIVAEKRQGALSKMVSWFRNDKPQIGAVPDLVTTPSGDPRFGRESVEMQCRRLADLCFMLHDYENAGNYYKLLRTDLAANERPWIKAYLASCLEAYGLCLVLQGKANITSRNTKEAKEDNKLDAAYEMYREAGEKELACRCSLLLFHVYLVKAVNDRAAALLHRAWSLEAKTNILYVAVCAEQAALCYLNLPGLLTRSNVTHVRKTALYLTLAGHRYRTDQVEHSLRCYKLALMIYGKFRGATWANVWEHINDSMARLAQRRGNGEECVLNISRLFEIVSPSMRTVTFSERVTKDLLASLDAIARAQKLSVYHNLPFPVVRATDVSVHTSSPGVFPAEDEVRARRHFVEMDDELRKYLISARRENYLLHPQSKAVMTNSRDIRLVSGETVTVRVLVRNPLAIDVRLQDLHILYRTSQDAMPRDSPSDVGESTADVTLAPFSTTAVRLQFTPTVPGVLRVVGIGLTHFGSIRGTIFFDDAAHLTCHVGDVMPCLDVSLNPTPPVMFEGQISKLEMTFTNVSSILMTKVVLKLSTRNVHIVQLSTNVKGVDVALPILENSVCALPQDLVIEPWASSKITVYVCATRGPAAPSAPVSNYIAVLIGYCNDAPPIVTRLYRFLHVVRVLSAMTLCHAALPPSARTPATPPSAFLAALQVRNQNPMCHNMRVVQISALSRAWSITPVTGAPEAADGSLDTSLFLTEPHRDTMYYATLSRKTSADTTLSMSPIFTPRETACHESVLAALRKILPMTDAGVDCTAWPLLPLIVQGTKGAGDLDVAPPASREDGFSFYADRGGAKPTDEMDIDLCNIYQPVAFVCVWACEMEGAVITGICSTSMSPKTLVMNPPRPLWATHSVASDGIPYIDFFDPAKAIRTIKIEGEGRFLGVGCVTTSIECPSTVSHDFTAEPFKKIDACLTIRNTTLKSHAMCLRLLQTARVMGPDKKYGTSAFRWVGKSQFRFEIPPDGSHSVNLSVCVLGPGVVNLKRLALRLSDGTTMEVQTAAPERWSVNVMHVAS